VKLHIEIKNNKDINGVPLDGIPFHPYYTVKDLFGVSIFLMIFFSVVFFAPSFGGLFLEPPNFVPADPLKTPDHIAPIWYMTPFYAILRAIPNKIGGVVAMGGSLAIIFVLPWLDKSPVKSIRYKGIMFKLALTLFVISFIILGYLGMVQPTPLRTLVAQICTTIYFLFFILMPFYSIFDKTKIVPERLT
jgi:ubiquinol-cytochrome c reductase cytochrome b subunit